MTEMQGALGLVQVEKLERFTEQRIANAAFLTDRLHSLATSEASPRHGTLPGGQVIMDFKSLRGSVQTPVVRPGCRHVYHQYTIRVSEQRDEWIMHLRSRGIGTAVHYP